MRRMALSQHRPWLLLGLAAALAFYLIPIDQFPGLYRTLCKGMAVGALAVYALHRAGGLDGRLIAAVMALGAVGDIAIEFDLLAGGAAFAAAHAVAIVLYLRNLRRKRRFSQNAAALALLTIPAITAWLLTRTQDGWELATAYAAILGVMAACAWASRFPRYRVGTGAVLFVVSDLFILGTEGGMIPSGLSEWVIWPLYFGGQFMIVTGVVQTLRHERVHA